MQVVNGLPEHLKPQAVELYWQAFGGKLGRVLGPESLAHAYLLRVLRPDHCICALSEDGTLLGIAGFKSPYGSLAGGETEDMHAIYGRLGSLWRRALLGLLKTEIDNERFLIDGICVAPSVRGQGIGGRLVLALIDEAQSRGYGAVRLEVVDTNIRARVLYERLGFAPWRSQTLGVLRHVFGFSRAVTMVFPLPPRPGA
jgi:ribosomal protein S18 acetylase RimI-like enzyme